MGCFAPTEPSQPTYAQQTRDTLQAQVDLAPQQFASEAEFQPMYQNLAMSNLTKLLNGNPGGPQTTTQPNTASATGWYDSTGKFVNPGVFNPGGPSAPTGVALPGGALPTFIPPSYTPGTAPAAGDTWEQTGQQFNTTNTTDQPATPGLTSVLAGANTAQRTADIGDVSALGPSATNAILGANPAMASLLAKLNTQASGELDAGSSLTPDQVTAMQQASRAAFAARGMSGSNAGISDELLRQFNLGQQLLQQRQGFAQSMVGQNQAVVGDPFMSILGRSSGAVSGAQSIAGTSGPSMFNPDDALSGSMTAGTNAYNAMFAAPSTMSDVSSVLGATGKLVGGIGSAMSI